MRTKLTAEQRAKIGAGMRAAYAAKRERLTQLESENAALAARVAELETALAARGNGNGGSYADIYRTATAATDEMQRRAVLDFLRANGGR